MGSKISPWRRAVGITVFVTILFLVFGSQGAGLVGLVTLVLVANAIQQTLKERRHPDAPRSEPMEHDPDALARLVRDITQDPLGSLQVLLVAQGEPGHWEPQPGEIALAAIPCARVDDVTVTTAGTHPGFAIDESSRELRIRTRDLAFGHVEDTGARRTGQGTLLVTTQRVAFSDPAREDWSEPWSGIARWVPTPRGVALETTNGRQLHFELPPEARRNAETCPPFVSLVMDIASHAARHG